jgi:hypothetical protein
MYLCLTARGITLTTITENCSNACLTRHLNCAAAATSLLYTLLQLLAALQARAAASDAQTALMEAELSRLRAIIAAAEAPETAAAPKRRRRGQTSIKVGPSGGKSRRSTRTSMVGISPLLSTAAAAAATAAATAATDAGATPTGSVQNTPRTAAAGSLAVTQLPALSDLDPQESVEALAVKAPRVLAKLKRLTATVVEKREFTKQGSRAVLSRQNSRAQLRSQRSSTAAAAAAAAADDSAAELIAAVAQFSKQSSELKAQLASAQRAAQRRDELHSAATAHLQAQLTALQAAKQGLVEVLQRCRGTVAVTVEEVQQLELEGDWTIPVPDAQDAVVEQKVVAPTTATLSAKPSQLQQSTAAAAVTAATRISDAAGTTTAARLTLTLAASDAVSDSSILSASARVRPATTGSSSSRHYSTLGMHRGIGHSARLQQQQQQQCASCSVQGSLQQWHSTDWQRAGDSDALPLTYADVDSLLWKPPSYSCAVQCNLGDDGLAEPQTVAVPETATVAATAAAAAAPAVAAVQDAAAADVQGSLAFAALHAEPHALQQLLALAAELTTLQAAVASGEHVSASSLLAALTRCTALHVPLLQRTAARYAHLCDRWKRVASHAATDRGCTGSGADRAFLCCLCFSDRRSSWGWQTAASVTVGAAGASNSSINTLHRGTLRPHTSSGLRQGSTAASSHAIGTGSSSAAQLYSTGAASTQRYTVSAAAGDDKRALLRARLQQSVSQPEPQFVNSFRSAKQRNSSSGHKAATATAVTSATRRPHTSAGVRTQRSVLMSTAAAAAAAQHDGRSMCSSVLIDLYSNSGSVVHSTSGSTDQRQQQQFYRGTKGPSAALTRQRPVTADTVAVRVAVSHPIGIY